jgi:hypothetical protein
VFALRARRKRKDTGGNEEGEDRSTLYEPVQYPLQAWPRFLQALHTSLLTTVTTYREFPSGYIFECISDQCDSHRGNDCILGTAVFAGYAGDVRLSYVFVSILLVGLTANRGLARVQ